MLRRTIRNLACLSIAAFSADELFKPGRASTYPNRQTQQGLIVAGVAYGGEEQVKAPFGKVNTNRFGVLPVLFLIENNGKKTLNLKRLRVQLISTGRQKVDSIPANEVQYLQSPGRPKTVKPTPPIPGLGKKKNPLASAEIEGRAFSAPMLAPGDSAHGFFYFRSEPGSAAALYVTGIEEAGTGKEMFYTDIPLATLGN
jgi:hypothetical protein